MNEEKNDIKAEENNSPVIITGIVLAVIIGLVIIYSIYYIARNNEELAIFKDFGQKNSQLVKNEEDVASGDNSVSPSLGAASVDNSLSVEDELKQIDSSLDALDQNELDLGTLSDAELEI